MDKNLSKSVIIWNRLQLGRYIRAVTGHNNLLYHLHNMDTDISPTCRFCLDGREEFNHLANDCPALWHERHTINAQDQQHSQPQIWTPLQIVDFTYFPKINEAFVKPLFLAEGSRRQDEHQGISQELEADDPMPSDTDTDVSVMDVSSLPDSSTCDDGTDSGSDISVGSP